MYKIKKISKIKNISQFGLEHKLERETEREREEGEKKKASPAILQGFAGRNSADWELKLLYATRATRGYWNHKILPRSKVRVFMVIEKRQCLRKSRYLR